MEVLYKEKTDCCGCGACFMICPKEAITMKEDQEGFKYPEVDNGKCINCMLCKKVCEFQIKELQENSMEQIFFAVKHKDEDVRKESTSGGIFTAISDEVLKKNGVVYGAKLDEALVVRHGRSVDIKERNQFLGSKYVQSDMSKIFLNVKEDLKNNRLVLFSGTPCQCSSLIKYLQLAQINIENLVVCDFICHGVSSPLIWRYHIQSCEKRGTQKIKSYRFRSKVNGWYKHTEEVIYDNNKIDNSSLNSQKNKILFHNNLTLRPSCFKCKYTNINRVSDITMGDFWGIKNSMPDFDDGKGISLAIVNTDKGIEYMDIISNSVISHKSSLNDCMQPRLKHQAQEPIHRKQFWDDFYSKGYRYITKKYCHYTLDKIIKHRLIQISTVEKIYTYFNKQ